MKNLIRLIDVQCSYCKQDVDPAMIREDYYGNPICEDCIENHKCDWCGVILPSDELNNINGYTICDTCLAESHDTEEE